MKKEKIIILIIVLLIILMISIVGIILILNNNEENKIAANEPNMEVKIDTSLKQVTNRNDFYIVQSCIEKFYTNYSEIFDEKYEGYIINTEEDKNRIKAKRIQKVYNMLDEEYINYQKITLENLTTKLSKTENTSILINNMYCVEKNQRISTYFVYGIKNGTLDAETIEFGIMVKIDSKNRTFKLILGEQVKKYNEELQKGQKLEIKEDEIKNDTYNTFTYDHITENEYINDLFSHYKKNMRFNKKNTYNLLDEDYKKICFENSDNYLLYLDSNYSKIISARIDEYSKQENSNYTEYIFKDKKGNYYIFKETAPFKYTVILDNYTILTQDFKEEYITLSDRDKIAFNINRFFLAINEKKYGYSYSVLSDSFKNNKYPSKSHFIKFVKQNFFEQNEIENISYEKENGLYICKVKISDATGEKTDSKSINIILKLNDQTGFEMSFGQ